MYSPTHNKINELTSDLESMNAFLRGLTELPPAMAARALQQWRATGETSVESYNAGKAVQVAGGTGEVSFTEGDDSADPLGDWPTPNTVRGTRSRLRYGLTG